MSYQCPRCSGSGEIPAHRNVLNGVCFKCNGLGTVARKPPARSVKWACYYAGVHLFNISAKTQSQALNRAVIHWQSRQDMPAFANVFSVDDIQVHRN